jgi:ADP-ribosylglycohydrolase
MILCTMDSLSSGYNLDDLAQTFCAWLFDGAWTPSGFVFDAGLTTFTALDSIRNDGRGPLESGANSPDDNGNGSLMRMLPAALYFAGAERDAFLQKIHEISAITHAHPRAKIGCGIYALLVRALCENSDPMKAYQRAISEALDYYNRAQDEYRAELRYYNRLISYQIPEIEKREIYSSGYVVHTLEASVWCFLRRRSAREALLEAVNLGLDTDTTGSVAGGLAGLAYGIEDIPAEWISTIARKKDIDELIRRFTEAAVNQGAPAV